METLKVGVVILPRPLPFDAQVYAGNKLLRRYHDYHPVFAPGSSDMFALNLWVQIPSGALLTIKANGQTHLAEVS